MTAIEMCLNCEKKKCSGTCESVRQAERDDGRHRKLTANGETHTLEEWEKITGLSYGIMEHRLRRGKRGSEVIKPKKKWKRGTDNG